MRHHYASLILLLLFSPFAQAQNSTLEFIANKGQWSGAFNYKCNTGRSDVYLEDKAFTYVVGASSNRDLMDDYRHGAIKTPPILNFHAYKMIFEQAKQPIISGSKAQSQYYNYFLGKDTSKWKSGIHPYLALDYLGLYEGIDVHVASENWNVKYDFIVQPNADVSQIQLRYEGVEKLSIKDGNLIIGTSVGDVMEMQPYAYQYINDQRKVVPCKYKLHGNKVSYAFPKGYDATQKLIIDPTVVFSTFTGSTADNWGFTATYDAQGNVYAGGLVSGTGYPVGTGAFQQSYGGGTTTSGSLYPCDMGIIKFNSTGTTKIYATYIGGNDNDQPHSMIVDANNNLIIAGRTYSNNFPIVASSYDTSFNGGADIVLVKLNATGTALIGSTYLGGSADDGVNFNAQEPLSGILKHNYGDDARSEVIIDNAGNIYITASTFSTNFPTTSSALQSTLQGGQDAIISKLNPTLSGLLWSSYVGGSDDDAGYVLSLNNAGTQLYMGGGTTSTNFPSTAGTYHSSFQGGSADGYILRFQNSAPYTLQAGTFIGTNNYDQVYGLQVDRDDDVYAMGQTLGGNFPVQNVSYSNPNSSQYVIKLNPSLTTNIYSTVFGSGSSTATNISPVAFLVDTCKNVYISGWGGTLGFNFPGVGTTNGLPVTPATIAAPVKATTDGFDMYFIVLSKDIQSLLYGAYLGRNSTNPGMGEHVDGGTSRFDKNGIIYQAICASCGGSIGATPFPTTPGSYSPNNGNPSNCNEAVVKIAFEFILGAQAKILPDTQGCTPFTVSFQNTTVYASSYEWDFGDGSPTDFSQVPPPHTYTTAGTYTIRLIAKNPTACNKQKDTAYLTVKVIDASIKADFSFNVTDSCGPYRAIFTNTSQYSNTPGAQLFTKFNWSFGDGTVFNGTNPPTHNYPDTGTYTVTLIMTDTTACKKIDTITKVVRIQKSFVTAKFTGPDSLCIGNPAVFVAMATNAQSITWNYGDGTTGISAIHNYTDTGTFIITMIAANPNTCNKFDTARRTIIIRPAPIADFIFSPIVPVTNEPIQFTNKSINATTYLWSFGDGATSTEEHPLHLFKKTGTFNTCLIARNASGCADTICKKVDADIVPALDLPTAFSPNGDGKNDVLFVRGAAVETVNLKIFNRWGELVFETNDMKIGWDGTYKGKQQEMESYAYTLYATFIDGTNAHKQGNVTLLR